MNFLCRIGFHKWSDWSDPREAEVTYGLIGTTKSALLQEAVCKKCNARTVRAVKEY